MIIECPVCESKVDGEPQGEVSVNDDHVGTPTKIVLVKCNVCDTPLLGVSELIQTGPDDFEWSDSERLWPEPDSPIDRDIPEIARVSLVEAQKCFKAKAYTACAVMCGRAIEGICKHYDATTRNLAGGLRDLRTAEVIDGRLFEWGEALRNARNLGAHASTDEVSRSDAEDLLDFSRAICDYVFLLSAKFDAFKERQSTKKKVKKKHKKKSKKK